MEHILSVVGKPVHDVQSNEFKTSKDKLKSEIDALDLIIQRGYDSLLQNPDKDVNPRILMEAIRLKNDLTDGNHGFLTNYGMEHLRNIENAKYQLIIEHLLEYIPEDKKSESLNQISFIEEEYYKQTDYYEEYLRAAGNLTEDEIQYKLRLWKESRNQQSSPETNQGGDSGESDSQRET